MTALEFKEIDGQPGKYVADCICLVQSAVKYWAFGENGIAIQRTVFIKNFVLGEVIAVSDEFADFAMEANGHSLKKSDKDPTRDLNYELAISGLKDTNK